MARYEFHAINRQDLKKLVDAGFLVSEIDKINNVKTPTGDYQKIDLNEPAWNDVIKSRRKFVRKGIRKGLSRQKLRANIKRLYMRKRFKTIFDFVKEEYKKGIVKAQPNNKWVWYELAKRNVPLFCSLCLQRHLKSQWQYVFAGYDEREISKGGEE